MLEWDFVERGSTRKTYGSPKECSLPSHVYRSFLLSNIFTNAEEKRKTEVHQQRNGPVQATQQTVTRPLLTHTVTQTHTPL